MPSTPRESAAQHVAIVGGGIAGLSAAWELQQAGLPYMLLEASDRWGGKIRTDQVHGFGETPFILEAGPDAFLMRKPWALHLARELNLDAQVIYPGAARLFVLRRGRPLPLPDGLHLLAPVRLWPFLSSPLFSLPGKLRALLDLLIPPRRDESDETLADFVRRRLGAEMLDRLGEPLLAGVYNGEPSRQSVQATFPQFPALEREFGSLIRGLRRAQQAAPSSEPPLFTFDSGAYELVTALAARLTGDLRLNAAAQEITRAPEGGYRITVANGAALCAAAVILAGPAATAASLLRSLAPDAAAHLDALRTSGIAAMYLGFRRQDVPHPLNGAGVVMPASERRSIDGITWVSSKWPGRAPNGFTLLRVFFGGPRTRAIMDLNDGEALKVVQAELAAILGIHAPPLFYRVYRWPDGYPQYDLGHLERVAAIESALPAGLHVTGSAYRGLGVPDCIRQGRDTARQVAAALARPHPAPILTGGF